MLGGETARVPLVAFVPVQPPPAVHEVALVEDQLAIETWPEVMLVGLAENATVGGAAGEELAVPPHKSKSILATTGGKLLILLSTAREIVLLPGRRLDTLMGNEYKTPPPPLGAPGQPL